MTCIMHGGKDEPTYIIEQETLTALETVIDRVIEIAVRGANNGYNAIELSDIVYDVLNQENVFRTLLIALSEEQDDQA